MTNVTIFGDGNMGTAIASVLAAGGATVDHITTSTPGATVTGDVVVLAVPYPALKEIVASYGDQLAGKVVVDITNPLNFATFDSLVVPVGSSAAAELAAAAGLEGPEGVQHHLRRDAGKQEGGAEHDHRPRCR